MAAPSERAFKQLALATDLSGPFYAAPWIGALTALGTRAARYSSLHPGRQLVLAVSVPKRDFAAVLLGCGWMLVSKVSDMFPPLEVLRSCAPGTPLRVITGQDVITDFFTGLDETHEPPRLPFLGTKWQVDKIRAVAPLDHLDPSERWRQPRPTPGPLSQMAGREERWEAWLCAPSAELTIVGTMTRLKDDLAASISTAENPTLLAPDGRKFWESERIGDVLLAKEPKAATWATTLLPMARFSEQPELPSDARAVILDGASAIKWVSEVDVPVVMAVLDRSVGDEAAAEVLVQLRNTRGEPVSIIDDIGVSLPLGIEALAFSVAL